MNQPTALPPPAIGTPPPAPAEHWPLATVLVVDDEPGMRNFLEKTLRPRVGQVMGADSAEAADALAQARTLSALIEAISARARQSAVWKVAYQHLLLSMIGFGLRVYSQHSIVGDQPGRWAEYHECIASAILGPEPPVAVDAAGRLIVIDGSAKSDAHDWDGDGLPESVVVAANDAGRIVAGDAQAFYDGVRAKVGEWRLLPTPTEALPIALPQPEKSAQIELERSGDPPVTAGGPAVSPSTCCDISNV
jgi:CheY-like chemotaxis protein